MQRRVFEVHVSGSGRPDGSLCGWGAAFRGEDGAIRPLRGSVSGGNPAHAQLEAAAAALSALPAGSRARIVSSHPMLVQDASGSGGRSAGAPAEAWERYLRAAEPLRVRWLRRAGAGCVSGGRIQDVFVLRAARQEAFEGSLGLEPAPPRPSPSPAAEGEPCIDVWADGSHDQHGRGGGGWGAVVLEGGKARALSGAVPPGGSGGSAARMEMLALAEALEAVPEGARARIRTDQKHAVEAMADRAWRWRRCGWRLLRGGALADSDVWERVLAADEARSVEWLWVEGGAHSPGHRLAHRLAGWAASGRGGAQGAQRAEDALAAVAAAGPAPGEGVPVLPADVDRFDVLVSGFRRRRGRPSSWEPFAGWGAVFGGAGSGGGRLFGGGRGAGRLMALEGAAAVLERMPHGAPVRLLLWQGAVDDVRGALDGGLAGIPPGSPLSRIARAAPLLDATAEGATQEALAPAHALARRGASQERRAAFGAFRARLRDAPWRIEGEEEARAMFDALSGGGRGLEGPLELLSAAEAGSVREGGALERALAPLAGPGLLREDARRGLDVLRSARRASPFLPRALARAGAEPGI